MVVRIAVCCEPGSAADFQQGFRQYTQNTGKFISADFHHETEQFLNALKASALHDFLIVAHPGALGMETVISSRELAPETPLLWCSNDTGFAVASYRLRCSLFLPLPLQADEVENALYRCLM